MSKKSTEHSRFGKWTALGCVISTSQSPIAPVEAVRLADDRMYENKRETKR